MKPLPCPTCGAPVISVWRAAWFGAFTRVKCDECGDSLGFSYTSTIAMIFISTTSIFFSILALSLMPYYLLPLFLLFVLIFLLVLRPLAWNLKSYGKKDSR